MFFKSLSMALATTALVGLSAPAFAEEPNFDATATAAPAAVAKYGLAQDLYAMGVEMKDALMVVTAAKIASGVQMTDVEREKETQTSEVTEEEDTADSPTDVATMLATAKELAADDETMMAMIEDIEAESARGRIGGASRTLSRLPAGAVDVWKIPFYGQSYAEVGIAGDGDAPLSAVVTDEYGNRVGCARSYDTIYCNFVPVRSGYFFVTVANNGRKRNSYYLLTN